MTNLLIVVALATLAAVRAAIAQRSMMALDARAERVREWRPSRSLWLSRRADREAELAALYAVGAVWLSIVAVVVACVGGV